MDESVDNELGLSILEEDKYSRALSLELLEKYKEREKEDLRKSQKGSGNHGSRRPVANPPKKRKKNQTKSLKNHKKKIENILTKIIKKSKKT